VGRSGRRLGENAVVAKGALEMVRRSDDSMVSLDSCWMGREAEVAVMVTSHITRETVRNGRKKLAGKDDLRNLWGLNLNGHSLSNLLPMSNPKTTRSLHIVTIVGEHKYISYVHSTFAADLL
jgi:hypothetical protein